MRLACAVSLVALCACGRIRFDGEPITDATTDDADRVGNDAPASFVGGSGTIGAVSCQGELFDTIRAAYVVGHPQNASQPELVLFNSPVECGPAGITTQAWDMNDAIVAPFYPLQWIDLQIGANADGTYPFSFINPPSATDAYATNYRRSDMGYGSCISQNNGQVVVTRLGDGSITVTFSLTFAASATISSATLTAVPCAGGWHSTLNN